MRTVESSTGELRKPANKVFRRALAAEHSIVSVRRSATADEVADVHADVAGDHSQQCP